MTPEPDPVPRFAKAFTAAGGVLLRGPVEKALADLGEMLRAERVTALFFPEDDAAAREIAETLVPFGPFNLTTGAEVRGGNTAVTAGFRSAEAAIAESGTIVETSAGGKSLLPGLIADVRRVDRARRLGGRPDGGSAGGFHGRPAPKLSFLSGPSRTGDIEQTLTVGAHGPKRKRSRRSRVRRRRNPDNATTRTLLPSRMSPPAHASPGTASSS